MLPMLAVKKNLFGAVFGLKWHKLHRKIVKTTSIMRYT